MGQHWDPRLLSKAVEATRAHLADLEDDQVPHALRPIRASSARRLPPPLAAVVIRELDRSEALRTEVVERMDTGDGSPATEASMAFLRRDEGWEARLDDASRTRADQEEEAEVARLARSLEASEAELVKARDRLKALKQTTAAELTEARGRIADLRKQLASTEAPPRHELRQLEAHLAQVTVQRDDLQAELLRTESLVERLRGQLLRARRSRVTDSGAGSFARVGPEALDLAKALDTITSVASPGYDGTTTPGAAGRPTFQLPAGLRPDAADAMDWVVKRAGPTTILIDGYNAAWLIDPARFSSAEMRQEVVRRAGLLRGASVAPSRVIVVFDSAHGELEPPSPGPVVVRWAESADDEICSLAESLDGDVVVVSTDREVQEGALNQGAVVLWSEAFVGWSAR